MKPATIKISPLYLITFLVAFCSIVYELLMAQTLALLTGNNILRYSTTIGLYLASMGIGVFLCTGKRLNRSVETLLRVEILLSFFGAVSVILFYYFHSLYSFFLEAAYPRAFSLGFFFVASYGVIAFVGVLTGFELPLLIHIREKEKEGTTNVVLGTDYFGSLAGAVLFPLVLLPYLGLLKSGFMTAALNVLAAFILLMYKGVGGKRSFTFFSSVNTVMLTVIVVLLSFSSSIEQYCLKKYYYYQEAGSDPGMLISDMSIFPHVDHYRSPYQNIDLVKNRDASIFYYVFSAYTKKFRELRNYPKDYWLFLNGDYQLFSGCDELYHEYMVHVPIIANKVPRRVLVLGGGDGLVDRELLKYKEIESITHVDIDQKMINVASTNPALRRFNGDSLRDPRVQVKIVDAFQFLRTGKDKYDAIFIDFPDPKDYNVSRLYSREFYYFVKNRLADDGFVAMDAPGSMTLRGAAYWLIYYNTIKAAGFNTVTPFVTVLENDNPEFDGMIDRQKEEVKEILTDLYQGFIMMQKKAGMAVNPYREDKIKKYILNEKRYKLAFSLPYPQPERINWSKVNSIMRPTLPDFSPSNIRLPY